MQPKQETIDADGVYTDAEGNSFQFRKGHVLAPGQKKGLKRVGDFPGARGQGVAEFAATVPSADEQAAADKAAKAKAAADAKAAQAQAAADAQAKADAEAAAKAAQEAENKQQQAPENK